MKNKRAQGGRTDHTFSVNILSLVLVSSKSFPWWLWSNIINYLILCLFLDLGESTWEQKYVPVQAKYSK